MDFKSILTASLLALTSFAAQAEVVQEVVIEGLDVVPEEVVDQQLTIEVGQDITSDEIRQQIKDLYATRLFRQVYISLEKGVLVLALEEQPVIRSIEMESSMIPTKDALEQLAKQGVTSGEMLKEDMLEAWRIGVESSLRSSGFSHAKVVVEITPAGRGVVEIMVTVTEGAGEKLKSIKFVGDKQFSDYRLKQQVTSETTGLLSFVMNNDLYTDAKLEKDRRKLIRFYHRHGYRTPTVTYSTESLAPTQRVWENTYRTATFNIDSGPMFYVESLDFADGNWDNELKEQLSKALVGLQNDSALESIANQVLQTYYANDPMGEYYLITAKDIVVGYDKAKVRLSLNQELNTVRFIYFQGNGNTHDEPLRRALAVSESLPFNDKMIKKSELGLMRLSFLKSARISKVKVEDGVYDLVVTISEASTAGGKLGGTWAGGVKFSVEASVSDKNFLGYGGALEASIDLKSQKQQAMLSYSMPNATISGHSYTTGLTWSKQSKDSKESMTYHSDSLSFAGAYTIPLTDEVKATIGASYLRNHYYEIEKASSNVRDYFDGRSDIVNQYRLSTGLGYSAVDSGYRPTSGIVTGINAMIDLPVSDSPTYYELSGRVIGYYPVMKAFDQSVVLRGRLSGSYAEDYEDSSREIPFFARATAGGLGTVRGYANASLGPKYRDEVRQKRTDDESDDNYYVVEYKEKAKGGNKMLVANVELQLPSPLPDLVTPYLFVDAGNVFDDDESISLSDLRGSAGISAVVDLPFMGKITATAALPFNDKPKDSFSNFSMGMGVMF